MAEYPLIRGRNQEEKNASIQHIIRSLARRTVKHATVYVPPVPLFMGCESMGLDKVIGRILVPFSGTLQDLFIRIGEMTTNIVRIMLVVASGNAETRKVFALSTKMERITLDMEIEAGALVQLVLEEGSFKDILVAMAIYPVVEDHKVKQFLLDEILGEEGEEDAIPNKEE